MKYAQKKPAKLRKLENQLLEKENEEMERKIREMTQFVNEQKRRDKIRKYKTQKPVQRGIRGKTNRIIDSNERGFASKIVSQHRTTGNVRFKKKGLRAYKEVLKQRNQKRMNNEASKSIEQLDFEEMLRFLKEHKLGSYAAMLKA